MLDYLDQNNQTECAESYKKYSRQRRKAIWVSEVRKACISIEYILSSIELSKTLAHLDFKPVEVLRVSRRCGYTEIDMLYFLLPIAPS